MKTDQDRVIDEFEKDGQGDLAAEVFNALEWASARLSQGIQELFSETEERHVDAAAREVIRTAQYRRRFLNIAVKLIERMPPRMLAYLDDDGLVRAIARHDGGRFPHGIDGFQAETVRCVGQPHLPSPEHGVGRGDRWVYDFSTKRGWSVRVSLAQPLHLIPVDSGARKVDLNADALRAGIDIPANLADLTLGKTE